MFKLIRIMALVCVVSAFSNTGVQAWPWGDPTLTAINGKSFSVEDFRNWWANYKEKDMPFPATPDKFIEWHLLSQEAEKMELYRNASFIYKLNVFLKARSLMLLKNEAINSKIKITEEMLRKHYEDEYKPIWEVRIHHYDTLANARKAYDDLTSGSKTFDDLDKKEPKVGGPLHHEKRGLRPVALKGKQHWIDQLKSMEPGDISLPFPDHKFFVVLGLEKISTPAEGDFDNIKKTIRRKIWDEEQAKLTNALVTKLIKKYDVVVDRKLMAQINEKTTSPALLNQEIITSSRGSFPARIVVEQLQNERKLRTRQKLDKDAMEELKSRLVNGKISQSVIGWDSLDRHYEEREPFKPIYVFYWQHRLIKELLGQLSSDVPPVADKEAVDYYQQHLKDFSHPELISYAMFTTDKPEQAQKVWLSVMEGTDFFKATKKYVDHDIPVLNVSPEKLESVLKEEIEKLHKDEVSSPFVFGDKTALVKLVDHRQQIAVPLEKVSGWIRKHLHQEELRKVRDKYLKKLKDKSKITVNESAWKSILKEFNN